MRSPRPRAKGVPGDAGRTRQRSRSAGFARPPARRFAGRPGLRGKTFATMRLRGAQRAVSRRRLVEETHRGFFDPRPKLGKKGLGTHAGRDGVEDLDLNGPGRANRAPASTNRPLNSGRWARKSPPSRRRDGRRRICNREPRRGTARALRKDDELAPRRDCFLGAVAQKGQGNSRPVCPRRTGSMAPLIKYQPKKGMNISSLSGRRAGSFEMMKSAKVSQVD